jgi:hypothetical protein
MTSLQYEYCMSSSQYEHLLNGGACYIRMRVKAPVHGMSNFTFVSVVNMVTCRLLALFVTITYVMHVYDAELAICDQI